MGFRLLPPPAPPRLTELLSAIWRYLLVAKWANASEMSGTTAHLIVTAVERPPTKDGGQYRDTVADIDTSSTFQSPNETNYPAYGGKHCCRGGAKQGAADVGKAKGGVVSGPSTWGTTLRPRLALSASTRSPTRCSGFSLRSQDLRIFRMKPPCWSLLITVASWRG
jgi:hypothetical protein